MRLEDHCYFVALSCCVSLYLIRLLHHNQHRCCAPAFSYHRTDMGKWEAGANSTRHSDLTAPLYSLHRPRGVDAWETRLRISYSILFTNNVIWDVLGMEMEIGCERVPIWIRLWCTIQNVE